MADSTATKLAGELGQACFNRIGALDTFAWWAITIALVLAAIAAIATIAKAFKETQPAAKVLGVPGAISTVLDSLGKFIEILGKQQVWLVLLVFGLASFWLADSISAQACKYPFQPTSPAGEIAKPNTPVKPA
jgi:hypothetical protein